MIKGLKNFKKVQTQYIEAKEEYLKLSSMMRKLVCKNAFDRIDVNITSFEESIKLPEAKEKYEKLEEVILIEGEKIIKTNSPAIYSAQKIDLLFKKAKEDLTTRFRVLKIVKSL